MTQAAAQGIGCDGMGAGARTLTLVGLQGGEWNQGGMTCMVHTTF